MRAPLPVPLAPVGSAPVGSGPVGSAAVRQARRLVACLLACLVLPLVVPCAGCATRQGERSREVHDDRAAREAIAPERASGYREVPRVVASRHLAVAAHPLAAEAAAGALARGGSALDAAIAAQAMLTLVEPQSSGIGGGAFLLYLDRSADRLIAFDGRETAPASARPERFLDDAGAPLPFLDAVASGASVGVPGVMAMLFEAHKAFGQRPWAEAFDAAIERAEAGFPLSPRLFHSIASLEGALHPAAARYLQGPGGTPREVGSVVVNAELAATLRALAEQGPSALYRGPIAADVVEAVARHGGDLSLEDLAGYRPLAREALCGPYRTYEVCGFPPPTSGATTVLAILGMLSRFDLEDDPLSARNAHLFAEASRLAYADRGAYLGDPAFARVPTAGLVDPGYLAERAALIDEDRALTTVVPGTPPGAPVREAAEAPELPSTSHLVIVDEEGDVACMTTSVEHVFGSRIFVRGFFLNNQLTDFAFTPTDEKGLVANALAPGKRPRSSMAPTLVFRRDGDGPREPVLAVGSPGGARIIGYVARTVVAVLDHGLDVQDAIELPHVVTLGGPGGGLVEIEDHPLHRARLGQLGEALRSMGHDVKVGEQNSGLHAVQWKDGMLHAGADPRREGVGIGR